MADDDADDRLLAKDALTECGSIGELQFVENGEELVDYLLRRGKFASRAGSMLPGLILLDLNMPKKDGREALREIKADPQLRQIPVVVLTTSKADTDIGRVYDLGANSYVVKPSSAKGYEEIAEKVRSYWLDVNRPPDCEAAA